MSHKRLYSIAFLVLVAIASPSRAQFVTPQDYGCVADGKTDCTKSIASAIGYLDAHGGGILYFPAGTYLHSGITLKGEITYQGAGSDATRLLYSGSSGNAITYTAGLPRIVMRDMSWNATGKSSGWAFRAAGDYPINSCIFENIISDDRFVNVLSLRMVTWCALRDLRLNADGGRAIHIGDAASGDTSSVVTIEHPYLTGGSPAMEFDKVTGVTVYDATIENSTVGVKITDAAVAIRFIGRIHFEVVNTPYDIGNTTVIVDGSLQDSSLYSGRYQRSFATGRPSWIEVGPSGDTTVENATETQIPLGTIVDSAGNSDLALSANNVVVAEPGYYDIISDIAVVSTASPASYVQSIKVNGTPQRTCYQRLHGNGEETIRCLVHAYLRPTAAVGAFLYQDSGGSRSVYNRSRLWLIKRTY